MSEPDLGGRLRQLIDAAPPLTVDEVVEGSRQPGSSKRRTGRVARLAPIVLAVGVAAAVAIALAIPGGRQSTTAVSPAAGSSKWVSVAPTTTLAPAPSTTALPSRLTTPPTRAEPVPSTLPVPSTVGASTPPLPGCVVYDPKSPTPPNPAALFPVPGSPNAPKRATLPPRPDSLAPGSLDFWLCPSAAPNMARQVTGAPVPDPTVPPGWVSAYQPIIWASPGPIANAVYQRAWTPPGGSSPTRGATGPFIELRVRAHQGNGWALDLDQPVDLTNGTIAEASDDRLTPNMPPVGAPSTPSPNTFYEMTWTHAGLDYDFQSNGVSPEQALEVANSLP